MSIVAYAPKANIQAHRLFDRRGIIFSTTFDSKTLARLLILFGALISAVPVAVAGGADAPRFTRVLTIRPVGISLAQSAVPIVFLEASLEPR